MEKIKRQERTLVCKGTWISLYRDTMSFANGNTAYCDFIAHNGAAAMVAEDADGSIVMIRQWRPGAEAEILELPAGGRERSRRLRQSGSLRRKPERFAGRQSLF